MPNNNQIADTNSDETKLLAHVNQLELAIENLKAQLIQDNQLRVAGFETQPVSLEQQEQALLHGQQHIKVTDYTNHHTQVLDYFKRFHVATDASTRFVSRMPGIIKTMQPSEQIIPHIQQINAIKDKIKQLVQTGRNHYQRHEFIHQVLPRVMTEQLYRHIHYSTKNIKSMWFGWRVKRQTNQSLTKLQAIDLLKDNKFKPKGYIPQQQWQAMIEVAIEHIQTQCFKRIQQQRHYKTHPTLAYSYYDDNAELKRYKTSIATPLILLEQTNKLWPIKTPLTDFKAIEHTDLPQKQADNHFELFKPLKLIAITD